jgi:hypothetical protein
MRYKLIPILLCLIFKSIISISQVLTNEERKLYNIILEYRKEKGLPYIPLSASLTYVAQTHVKDLAKNKPDLGNCNAHSWSSNGPWLPCCYTPDHAQAKLMWSKPQELTTYKGDGFEIACGSNGCCSDFNMTADYALESWKKSSAHNAVIINEGIWNNQWHAIGIGLFKGFAVVWFGNEFDNE